MTGLLLCAVSIKDFAMPANKEMNDNGVYRFSRNPMYVAYFLIFSGTALLTKSLILFGIVVIFRFMHIGLLLLKKDGAWNSSEKPIGNI